MLLSSVTNFLIIEIEPVKCLEGPSLEKAMEQYLWTGWRVLDLKTGCRSAITMGGEVTTVTMVKMLVSDEVSTFE